jgi:hypothetical protein
LTKWTVDEYKTLFKAVKAGSPAIPTLTGSEADPTKALTGLTKVTVSYDA